MVGKRVLKLLTVVGAMVLGVSVVIRYEHMTPTTLALLLVLAILAISTRWGRTEAIIVSAVAALLFDLSYRPADESWLTSPQYWLALATFLATAVTASELALRARERTREAERRRRDLERLNILGSRLLSCGSPDGVIQTFLERAGTVFEATGAAFCDGATGVTRRSGKDGDAIPAEELVQATAGLSTGFRGARGDWIAPVRLGKTTLGAVGLRSAVISLEVIEAAARLLAIGLDRLRAMERAAAVETLRKSNEIRSTVLDAVAHDLKTPLTSIKMSVTAMLGAGAAVDPSWSELLSVINEEADRLTGLAGQAIMTARDQAGLTAVKKSPREVRELVTAVLNELSLGERGRTVEVNVPPDLPRVEIDLHLMRQAIKQVLDNAHKYSPADRPIRLTARAESDAVVLSVQDFGPGIAAEERKLVFEKFYRGSREARSVPGTGLGLAIAKRIVEAGGGKIELESTEGAGSTFRFRLPIGKG